MKKFIIVSVLSLFACAAFFVGCKPPVTQKPTVYSVTYNLDGGRIEGEYRTSYSAGEAFALPVPVKDNHEFLGWKDSAGKEWTEITKTTVGNRAFFASWRQIVFTVTYDLAGGENNPANPAVYNTKGATVTLAPATKTGYKFLGWADSSSAQTGNVTEIPAGSAGNKKFFAKWEVIIYDITYDLSGGENNPDNPATYSVESGTIKLAAPVREGYKFLGWRDKNVIGGGDVTEIPAGSTGNKAFAAKWEKTVFSVKYELEGGTNHPDNPESYSSEGEDITLYAPTREGYEFVGWIDASSMGTQTVDKIPAGSKGDKVFTAIWKREIAPEARTFVVRYELTYKGQRSSVEFEADVAEAEIKEGEVFNGLLPEAIPDNPLYKFVGWVVIKNEGDIKITLGTEAEEKLLGEDGETITLVAKVVKYFYEIEYVLEYEGITSTVEGHDGLDNGKIAEGEDFEGKLFAFVPTDAYFKAAGWVALSDGKEIEINDATEFFAELADSDDVVRLYAKSVRYKYVVRYELDYGGVACSVNGETTVADGIIGMGESFAEKLLTFVPTRTGYEAEGWVIVRDGKETALNAASVFTEDMLEADGATVKLYAKSTHRLTVNVVYNLIDTVKREYQSNNKGVFITFSEYGEKLTVNKSTVVNDDSIKDGERFAGKLPKIDQTNCGWVYKTANGYVYCTGDTVFDLSKAELENGNLVLYACLTEYWIGPY